MHPNILLYGSAGPLSPVIPLRAGNVSLFYEAGFLRYINVEGVEVLRMINYYIRDHNWGTIPMTISNEKIEKKASSFRITYESENRQGDIEFKWSCAIEGKEDSSISFEIEGEALHSFRRNRLGFTVLHPIKPCAGKECTITHSDLSKEVQKFPEHIAPHQPFFDIVAMKWNPANNAEGLLYFEGETFETEDQRNWSDASYKTYCTPLYKPFPALVNSGDKVKQRVNLHVIANKAHQTAEKPLTLSADTQNSASFPSVGITWSNLPHNPQIIELVRKLNIDFVRIELFSDEQKFSESVQHALTTDFPLEVVLFFEQSFNLEFLQGLIPFSDRIKQFIVLPAKRNSTDDELIQRTFPLLRKMFPQSKVGGGTDKFFTELNRERTPTKEMDFLSFSINPQAHASDLSTMVENLESQVDVISSCRIFAGGKDIHVGPVTFKTRPNSAEKSDGEEKPPAGYLPPSVDARQLSLFGAGWMLGCFKYLAESGVSSITFFESCGWKGLMPHKMQPWPEEFIGSTVTVYPLYVVLLELLKHKNSRIVRLVTSDPLSITGLAFVDTQGKYTTLLANHTREEQLTDIPSGLKLSRYAIIDPSTILELIKHPESGGLSYNEMQGSINVPSFSIALLS